MRKLLSIVLVVFTAIILLSACRSTKGRSTKDRCPKVNEASFERNQAK